MSSEDGTTTGSTPSDDDAARIQALEGQLRELAEKARSQENKSLQTKRRLEEVSLAAQVQMAEVVEMLTKVRGDEHRGREGDGHEGNDLLRGNTKEGRKESLTSIGGSDEHTEKDVHDSSN
ncbi:unnamed protein product [Ectocarpus fasciculatus]